MKVSKSAPERVFNERARKDDYVWSYVGGLCVCIYMNLDKKILLT